MSKFMLAVKKAISFVAFARFKAAESSLEAKITSAIVKRGNRSRKIPKNIDAILVQFPKISRALAHIKSEFDSLDGDKNKALDLKEISECLRRLNIQVTEEEAQTIFSEVDMDHDGNLQFKEFVLFLAFIYLMDPLKETEESIETRLKEEEVEKAFEIMVDAFLYFDVDLDGVLVKDEVLDKFGAAKRKGGSASFARGRFVEMDYDNNGRCTFKEFLFAFVGWVGTEDDEEDEDEEE